MSYPPGPTTFRTRLKADNSDDARVADERMWPECVSFQSSPTSNKRAPDPSLTGTPSKAMGGTTQRFALKQQTSIAILLAQIPFAMLLRGGIGAAARPSARQRALNQVAISLYIVIFTRFYFYTFSLL